MNRDQAIISELVHVYSVNIFQDQQYDCPLQWTYGIGFQIRILSMSPDMSKGHFQVQK